MLKTLSHSPTHHTYTLTFTLLALHILAICFLFIPIRTQILNCLIWNMKRSTTKFQSQWLRVLPSAVSHILRQLLSIYLKLSLPLPRFPMLKDIFIELFSAVYLSLSFYPYFYLSLPFCNYLSLFLSPFYLSASICYLSRSHFSLRLFQFYLGWSIFVLCFL